jgi:ligand-binding SRPBCC domain-containing protein
MRIHQIKKTQILPISLDEAWDFFSTPLNLNEITPENMSFEILTDLRGVQMYPGMIINYKVSPFLGIKLRWTTEITHVADKHFFVDEQRFGPYAFWHHKHFFETHEKGVLMTDIIDYGLPFGPFGELAKLLFVERQLTEIFDYRYLKLQDLFPQKKEVY